MKLKLKKSEEEIRRIFFGENLKLASGIRARGEVDPRARSTWSELAELRLFSQVVHFKPAGVNRNFNLGLLVNFMNNIYEDEEDTDFEMFLRPQDFEEFKRRKEIPQKNEILIFRPAYKIRPSAAMIMDKLNGLFNMELVEKNQYLPDNFTNKEEFKLPDSFKLLEDSDTSLFKKEVKKETSVESERPLSGGMKKRKKSPSNSRSATPVSKIARH